MLISDRRGRICIWMMGRLGSSLFWYKGDSAMSHGKTTMQCALCREQLTFWNAYTCTHCGRKLCHSHVHAVRLRHSYVLSSVCAECSACYDYAWPKMSAARKTSAPPPTTWTMESHQLVPK